MFSAVLILILLTEMIIYATSTGVFEQRKSANEMRQKLAFHAADSGIQHAKEFFLANAMLLTSPELNVLPDGTDGWFATGAERWLLCSSVDYASDPSHPCNGATPTHRANNYFYSFGGSNELPLGTSTLISPAGGEQVTVHALLCMIQTPLNPGNQACNATAPIAGDLPRKHFMITLLARGESECASGVCGGEALVQESIASTKPAVSGKSPGVPLVSKSTFPPNGTAEIVPNPDGSYLGVAASAWLNGSTSCGASPPVDLSSGSWATCERDEWYNVEDFPADYACPWPQCACKESEFDKLLSQTDDPNFDLVLDPAFPCDLFEYLFGVPKTPEGIALIKSTAKVIENCDGLNGSSSGLYWVSGPTCDVKVRVGSATAPVILVSAASATHFNAGAEVFGILFVTDAEDPNATFAANGNATVYGMGIMDATLDRYNGTFQLVYLENVLEKALETPTIGVASGGWVDYIPDWH